MCQKIYCGNNRKRVQKAEAALKETDKRRQVACLKTKTNIISKEINRKREKRYKFKNLQAKSWSFGCQQSKTKAKTEYIELEMKKLRSLSSQKTSIYYK